MEPKRVALLERLAAGEPLLLEYYGTGVYPAAANGYTSQLSSGGVGDGHEFRGITIFARYLGSPKDSAGIRFMDGAKARATVQKALAVAIEQYGKSGEVYSATQKVLDTLVAQKLNPQSNLRDGQKLTFELDFLDSTAGKRTILVTIKPKGGSEDWTLVADVKLLPAPNPLVGRRA
jgi:hypothetical protein